jgi:hypothetical protein
MIPRIPTGQSTGKDWGTTNDAGKGSSPRNLSEAFRSNFDSINWGPKAPKSPTGFTRVVHKPDGQKITTFAG